MSSDVREVLQKGTLALALRLAGAGVGFLLTVVATRMLGEHNSGLFFLAISMVTLLGTVSQFGFDRALTRFIGSDSASADWNGVNGAYRSAMQIVFALSLAVSIVLFLGADLLSSSVFGKPDLAPVLHRMAWVTCFAAIHWLHAFCFQGLRDMLRFLWFQNLGVGCLFLMFVAVMSLWNGKVAVGLLSYASCYCAASATMCAMAVTNWVRRSTFRWRGVASRLPELLPVAFPLMGFAFVGQCLNWLPQLVLGATRDATEVSLYHSAFRTAQLTSLVLMAGNAIALPKLAALHARGEQEQLQRVMVVSTRVMVAVCLPFLLILTVFPQIVMEQFGEGFASGSSVLRVLALGQFVNVATGSVGGLLNMTGHERSALTGSTLALLLMIPLTLALIPLYGMFGAAITQAVCLVVQMLFFTWVVQKRFGFFPLAYRFSSSVPIGSTADRLS